MDSSGRYFINFPDLGKTIPIAYSSGLNNALFYGFSSFPTPSLLSPGNHLSNKLPVPEFLSQALLSGRPEQRQEVASTDCTESKGRAPQESASNVRGRQEPSQDCCAEPAPSFLFLKPHLCHQLPASTIEEPEAGEVGEGRKRLKLTISHTQFPTLQRSQAESGQ